MWAELLTMTKGEVDRAMWLEENLSQEWYDRWIAWCDVVGAPKNEAPEIGAL